MLAETGITIRCKNGFDQFLGAGSYSGLFVEYLPNDQPANKRILLFQLLFPKIPFSTGGTDELFRLSPSTKARFH